MNGTAHVPFVLNGLWEYIRPFRIALVLQLCQNYANCIGSLSFPETDTVYSI